MPQADTFPQILPITLHEEGGFANNPDDPGGMTMLGVTKRNWESWVGHPVTEADMRALTPATVAPFYRVRYYNATGCANLPVGLGLCVFDFAVNSGDGRAVMELQKIVGVPADGHFGPQTLAAVQKFLAAAKSTLVTKYQAARQSFDEGLSTFDEFGDGWTARTKRITAQALAFG